MLLPHLVIMSLLADGEKHLKSLSIIEGGNIISAIKF